MKYKLTEETKEVNGVTLHRIQCVTPFSDVGEGELGGWVENEENLSQEGDAWVYGNACVYGGAKVSGNAQIYGEAIVAGRTVVYGQAKISGSVAVIGEAVIQGDAKVSSDKDYTVIKNNWSSGRYFTWTKSNNMWSVGCFYGTRDELIHKAYKDSKCKGDCYKAAVEYAEKTAGICDKAEDDNEECEGFSSHIQSFVMLSRHLGFRLKNIVRTILSHVRRKSDD